MLSETFFTFMISPVWQIMFFEHQFFLEFYVLNYYAISNDEGIF